MSQQAHWRDVHKLIDRLLELVHSGTTTAEVAAHDLLQEVIPISWIVLVHSTGSRPLNYTQDAIAEPALRSASHPAWPDAFDHAYRHHRQHTKWRCRLTQTRLIVIADRPGPHLRASCAAEGAAAAAAGPGQPSGQSSLWPADSAAAAIGAAPRLSDSPLQRFRLPARRSLRRLGAAGLPAGSAAAAANRQPLNP